MIELGKRHINHLWVEGGATLAGSLIKEKLVDEPIVYIAPKLLGNQAKGLCDLPYLNKLADAPLWTLKSIEQIEDDVKLIYRYKTKIRIKMLKKLLQAVIIGLITAIIIIFVSPFFYNQAPFLKDILSIKMPLELLPPAVVNVYNQSFTYK